MSNHDRIYQNEAESYERLISKQPSLLEVLQNIRPLQNTDVVDLGAGTGRLSEAVSPHVKSLIATDNSQAMLDVLKQKLTKSQLHNWRTIVSDHRSIPLESESADLVLAGWSICYLASSNVENWQENIKKMMDEIQRILRKDGTVIIIETLGTGFEQPNPPSFLTSYYRVLEEEYGFSFKWIRLDYQFDSLNEATQLTGFFFGDGVAEKVTANNWINVPECAGIWWKRK